MIRKGKTLSPHEILRVAERLALAYPYVAARKKAEGVLDDPPLDSLMRAVLSQDSTDLSRDRAFAALKANYPDWDAVAEAPTEEVLAAIRVTNHAPTKAQRIHDLLSALRNAHGTPLSLDFLRDWPTEEIMAYLQQFKGVGVKSAAVVCLFSLRRPVMVVDRHVHRVTQRLGWIEPTTTPERAHTILQALIPPSLVFPLHVGLWEHGRVTCRPVPKCGQCAIYAFCIFLAKTAPEPPLAQAIAITAGEEQRKAA